MTHLVAFDGSDEAERALAYAADVAEAIGSPITVVYAVKPSVYDEGGSEPVSTFADADDRLFVESLDEAEERGLEVLDRAAAFAEERGHTVETELIYGAPVPAIADYADSEGVNAIYVGHRGLSQRTESMLGSVAKGLVERATVPVTVVR